MVQASEIGEKLSDSIQWRIHLGSAPSKVFKVLTTDEGRQRFWAERAPEINGHIHFDFPNGMKYKSKVIEKKEPSRFVIEYFGGSKAQFEVEDDGAGGTDLTLTEKDVPKANRLPHLPGWVSVLMNLKAVVDFSIDLRNHDSGRTWERGYVDV